MKIKCPECEEISQDTEWLDSETGCEDCGSHPAKACPKCDHRVDGVYHDLEEYEVKEQPKERSVRD